MHRSAPGNSKVSAPLSLARGTGCGSLIVRQTLLCSVTVAGVGDGAVGEEHPAAATTNVTKTWRIEKRRL